MPAHHGVRPSIVRMLIFLLYDDHALRTSLHTAPVQDSVSTAAPRPRYAPLPVGLGGPSIMLPGPLFPADARSSQTDLPLLVPPQLANRNSPGPFCTGSPSPLRLLLCPLAPPLAPTGRPRCASTRRHSPLLLDATSVCAAPPCRAFSTTRRLSIRARLSFTATHPSHHSMRTPCVCRPRPRRRSRTSAPSPLSHMVKRILLRYERLAPPLLYRISHSSNTASLPSISVLSTRTRCWR